MKKTVSQKIARVFEIVCYLWLLPSVISLFYPAMLLVGCLVTASVAGALLALIPFLIFGAGVFLLVQYYRHSRGLLGEGKIAVLWIGTFLFNLLPLVPSAYGFYSIPKAETDSGGQELFIIVWGVLILWWSAAILMSVTALMSHARD